AGAALRRGGLQRALGAREPLEGLPVTGDLEQREHLLGRLGADPEPVASTLAVDVDERGLLGGVVLADLLDHTTVALGARVGDDDAVVGGADLAHPLETNLDSHGCGSLLVCMGVGPAPSTGWDRRRWGPRTRWRR